jgi:xylulose-5-phosphate/fructose-6-phosphate phosphoketolase
MCVLNQIDRFSLCGDVIDRVPSLGAKAAYLKQAIRDRLIDHKQYIRQHGDDMPAIRDWRWGGGKALAGASDTAGDQA